MGYALQAIEAGRHVFMENPLIEHINPQAIERLFNLAYSKSLAVLICNPQARSRLTLDVAALLPSLAKEHEEVSKFSFSITSARHIPTAKENEHVWSGSLHRHVGPLVQTFFALMKRFDHLSEFSIRHNPPATDTPVHGDEKRPNDPPPYEHSRNWKDSLVPRHGDKSHEELNREVFRYVATFTLHRTEHTPGVGKRVLEMTGVVDETIPATSHTCTITFEDGWYLIVDYKKASYDLFDANGEKQERKPPSVNAHRERFSATLNGFADMIRCGDEQRRTLLLWQKTVLAIANAMISSPHVYFEEVELPTFK
jgi:hypothetical protein